MKSSDHTESSVDMEELNAEGKKVADNLKKAADTSAHRAAALGGAIVGAGLSSTAATIALGTAAIPVLGPVTVAAVGLAVTALTKRYSTFAINKKTAPVEPVSETWETRPKANMIKWLMKQSGVSLETVAEYLGCSVAYLNTKLARDSFSFEDIILAAYACGYTFTLANNNGDGEAVYRVDLIRHFENSEPNVLERINAIEERIQTARREEYEKKKAELESELQRMKEEYGFED